MFGFFSGCCPPVLIFLDLNFSTALHPSLAVGTSPPCSFFLQPHCTEPPFL